MLIKKRWLRGKKKLSDGKYWTKTVRFGLLGSLSNNDGDGNAGGKKAIGLDWQNNISARVSRFFVHFFAVVARLRRETA